MRRPEPDVRALRRADWRFLLPDPRPARAVAVTPGPPAEALPRVAAEVRTPATTEAASCDLVVACDPSPRALRQAWQLLRPGGACYTEWRGPGRTRLARRRLQRAGFVVAGAYWPWPAVDACRAWLPLDAAAGAYLARDAAAGAGLLRRVWRAARAGVGRTRVAADLLPRRGIVACRPPVPPHWLATAAGLAADAPLSVVLQTHGASAANKAVALVGAVGAPGTPRAVVKAARTREGARGLQGEARALRVLASLGPARPAGIPVLLAVREARPTAVGQSAVTGAPMLAAHVVAGHAALARQATRWLAGCARATAAPAASDERLPRWRAWRARVETEAGAALTAGDRACLDAAFAQLPALPGAVEHRDFSPWNVLQRPGDSLGVLDWESADLDGLAGPDLVYFLTHLAFYRRRLMGWRYARRDHHALQAAYLSHWAGAAPDSGIARDCLEGFGGAVGVPREAWPAVRLLTWLSHVATGLERRDRGAPSAGDPLFLALLRAEAALMQSRPPERLAA